SRSWRLRLGALAPARGASGLARNATQSAPFLCPWYVRTTASRECGTSDFAASFAESWPGAPTTTTGSLIIVRLLGAHGVLRIHRVPSRAEELPALPNRGEQNVRHFVRVGLAVQELARA